MTTNQDGALSQQMFGSQAPAFAASRVHISDDSLHGIERLASTGPYGWAVDLGTGAGFTAFAMTGRSQNVVASDITRPMLEQTRRIGRERDLSNVLPVQNAAEHLPFADNSLDLITCRVAGHHFADFEQALTEIQRVLKPGGALVMADNVSPKMTAPPTGSTTLNCAATSATSTTARFRSSTNCWPSATWKWWNGKTCGFTCSSTTGLNAPPRRRMKFPPCAATSCKPLRKSRNTLRLNPPTTETSTFPGPA